MRLNIYLNEKNSKEKLIIDLLESKLNKSAFIKELLYKESNEISFAKISNIQDNIKKELPNINKVDIIQEEYEEILALDEINF